MCKEVGCIHTYAMGQESVTIFYEHVFHKTPPILDCIATSIFYTVILQYLIYLVSTLNPSGGEIFHVHPDRPWGPPSLLYQGYRVSPGYKAAGAWR